MMCRKMTLVMVSFRHQTDLNKKKSEDELTLWVKSWFILLKPCKNGANLLPCYHFCIFIKSNDYYLKPLLLEPRSEREFRPRVGQCFLVYHKFASSAWTSIITIKRQYVYLSPSENTILIKFLSNISRFTILSFIVFNYL